MRREPSRCAWILLMLGVLACGCTSMGGWKHQGKMYTSEEILVVFRQEAQAELARLAPVGSTLPGSVTVVLPNAARLRKPRVLFSGWGSPAGPPRETIVEMSRIGDRAIAEAIERGQVFSSVVITETYDPASFVVGTEWAAVLDVTYPNTAEWYLRHTATGEQVKVPVNYYVATVYREGILGLHLADWPAAVYATALRMGEVAGQATRHCGADPGPVAATRRFGDSFARFPWGCSRLGRRPTSSTWRSRKQTRSDSM